MDLKPDSFTEVLDYWSEKLPEKNAYIFLADGESKEIPITYGELKKRVVIFAANLQKKQCFQQRVLILNDPGIDFIVSFLGCLYAGVIPVPLYPPDKHSLDRVITVSYDCTASIALADCNVIEKFESYKTIYKESLQKKSQEYVEFIKVIEHMQIVDSALMQQDHQNALDYVKPKRDQTAFLQYTSGSTSKPKGVEVSHYNLIHNSMLMHKLINHDPSHCKVSWLPPFHDMGLIGEVLQNLYSGTTLVFMSPNAFLKKPIRWLKAITKYSSLGPVTCGAPNFGYEFCIETVSDEQLAELDLSNWKLAYNGSEPVRISTVERFIKKFSACGFRPTAFQPVYGLAENTLLVTFSPYYQPPLFTRLYA